jgi:hypothetical protein
VVELHQCMAPIGPPTVPGYGGASAPELLEKQEEDGSPRAAPASEPVLKPMGLLMLHRTAVRALPYTIHHTYANALYLCRGPSERTTMLSTGDM